MQPELFSQMLDRAKENNNQFDVNAMAVRRSSLLFLWPPSFSSLPVHRIACSSTESFWRYDQTHFHNRYQNSLDTNPNFYFVPPSALIVMGATYFHPGFFSNGTIGAGGSANLASIASFVGARFGEDGSITYVPERSTSIPLHFILCIPPPCSLYSFIWC